MNKLEILELFPFYRQSTKALRAAMDDAAEFALLPPHSVFYKEGDRCSHFAAVGRGNIRVFKSSPDGREATLYHVRDGEPCLVNMLCVMLDRPAMATGRAQLATEAVVFPADAMREWIVVSEPMRRFVFETMAARMVDVMARVEEVSFQKVDSRLAALLLQRFAAIGTIAATHEDIAAELGTAREVVSRALEELARRGAIRISRGHLELRDGAILRQLI